MNHEKLRALLALRLGRQILPPPPSFKLTAAEVAQPLLFQQYRQLPFYLRAELATGLAVHAPEAIIDVSGTYQYQLQQACLFTYYEFAYVVYVCYYFHADSLALKTLFGSDSFKNTLISLLDRLAEPPVELFRQLPVAAICRIATLRFDLNIMAQYVLAGERVIYSASARAPRLRDFDRVDSLGGDEGYKSKKEVKDENLTRMKARGNDDCQTTAKVESVAYKTVILSNRPEMPDSVCEGAYHVESDASCAPCDFAGVPELFYQSDGARGFYQAGKHIFYPKQPSESVEYANNSRNESGSEGFFAAAKDRQHCLKKAQTANSTLKAGRITHCANLRLPVLPQLQDLIYYCDAENVSDFRRARLTALLAHCWYWRARALYAQKGKDYSPTALGAALETAGRARARFQFALLYFSAEGWAKEAKDSGSAGAGGLYKSLSQLLRCDLSDFAAAVADPALQGELLSFVQTYPVGVLIKTRVFEFAAQLSFTNYTAAKLLSSLAVFYCDLYAADARGCEEDDFEQPGYLGLYESSVQVGDCAYNRYYYESCCYPIRAVKQLCFQLLNRLDTAPLLANAQIPARACFVEAIYYRNSDECCLYDGYGIDCNPQGSYNEAFCAPEAVLTAEQGSAYLYLKGVRGEPEMRATAAFLAYRAVVQNRIEQFYQMCAVKDIIATSVPVVSGLQTEGFERTEWQSLFDIILHYVELTDLPLPQGPQSFKNRYQNAFVERDLNAQESTFAQIERLFLLPEVIYKGKFSIVKLSQSDVDDLERVAPLAQQASILLNGCELTARMTAGLAGTDEICFLVENYLTLLHKGVLLSSDEQTAFACAVFLVGDGGSRDEKNGEDTGAACRNALGEICEFLRPDLKRFLEIGLYHGVRKSHLRNYAADPEAFIKLRAALDYEKPELYFDYEAEAEK